MKSSIAGPSVAAGEHKPSTGFEGELWIGLNAAVHARHMTMSELVFAIRSAARATSPRRSANPYPTTVAHGCPPNASHLRQLDRLTHDDARSSQITD